MTMNKTEQEALVQKIRTQYTGREHTELDELKALDRKVKRPVTTFVYLFGSAAALIMGAGMSLIMTDIGQMLGLAETMLPGLVSGIAGLSMALVNYPIYKRLLARRRRKYAEKILALSDKIMKD